MYFIAGLLVEAAKPAPSLSALLFRYSNEPKAPSVRLNSVSGNSVSNKYICISKRHLRAPSGASPRIATSFIRLQRSGAYSQSLSARIAPLALQSALRERTPAALSVRETY